MTQQKNSRSKAPQGKPSSDKRGGNGPKDMPNDMAEQEAVEQNYLDEDGNPDAQVHVRHENRNVDKGRDDQGKTEKGE
ncbi:hypothetical protein [Sphingobacterium suaedae]|uniref:Glycogen biosynthesis protein GlgD n=1 Tax=Sphingobacterium suaedae TaxID=1686402 RepID=A0ABW5KEH2_9SPHI